MPDWRGDPKTCCSPLLDPRNGTSLARLKPIVHSDRFELFYWSDLRGRWRPFGDFGRLRLTLARAHEIFREETIFRIRSAGEAAYFSIKSS
jgi:hypothetical protein